MDTHPSNSEPSSAFLRLFIQHENALRAYARILLPTWDAVDEAIQESSIIMWKKFEQLDDPANFLKWARVIVRFESLRMRRTKARDRHVFHENCYELLASEEEEEGIDNERELGALKRCLSRVKPDYQQLLLARYSGTYKLKQLAQLRGQSPNSLYKLLQRLRHKLGHCIESTLAHDNA